MTGPEDPRVWDEDYKDVIYVESLPDKVKLALPSGEPFFINAANVKTLRTALQRWERNQCR